MQLKHIIKASRALKGLWLPTQGSFLLRSRLNKDVLQILSPGSCHMQKNITIGRGSGCGYGYFKGHLEILEILRFSSFHTVKWESETAAAVFVSRLQALHLSLSEVSKEQQPRSANSGTEFVKLINHLFCGMQKEKKRLNLSRLSKTKTWQVKICLRFVLVIFHFLLKLTHLLFMLLQS